MAAIFRKILCPVDFSDNSMAALTEAAKLARKDDALLYLMHVEFVPMSKPAKLADYMTVSTEPGRLRLQKLAQKRLARVRHEVLEQVGWPAKTIEKAAKDLDVDLIVIATQGRTGINRLLLGSVAEHLVRTSKRSVLSFSPGAAVGRLKKILCLVDLDPKSIAALQFGWRLAKEYGAELSLLRVLEPSGVRAKSPTPEWEQGAQAQLAKVAARSLGGSAKYKLVVRRGNPESAILEVENEIHPDLLIMAYHGRGRLSQLVSRTLAEHAVRDSAVPVLTVQGRYAVA